MSPTFSEACSLSVAAGLLVLALAWALQPLLWTDPVPTAAQLYTAHSKES